MRPPRCPTNFQFAVRLLDPSTSARQTEVCRTLDSLRYVFRLGLWPLRSGEDVMEEDCQEAEQRDYQPDRLGDPLPVRVAERYLRIGGPIALQFPMLCVVRNTNY